MNDNFTLEGGYAAAAVHLDPSVIYGSGRPELPMLVAPLDFTLRGPKSPGRCFDFQELRCRLSLFDNPACIALALPIRLNVRALSYKELAGHPVPLEIPLDRTRLALINRLRNGGDVLLRLDLELLFEELFEVAREPGSLRPIIWSLVERYQLPAKVTVTLPRSAWLERVLGPTGFSKVHVLELPAIPVQECPALTASFNALQEAVNLESQGSHREAIHQCRVALEPFLVTVDKSGTEGERKEALVLDPLWRQELGKSTYEWVNAALIASEIPASPVRHASSAGFEQLDAQMLLAAATALIAQAARTQPPASPSA
ncbi:MAG: hypothetical protein ABSE16_19240 [Verrucomicrobiota bacterium]|jgi:hypothetical protein